MKIRYASRILCVGLVGSACFCFALLTGTAMPASSVAALPALTPRPTLTPTPARAISVSSIRGTAYLDANQNGQRDSDEVVFSSAWYKITDGGNWYVCGPVGDDATFGVIVSAGAYFVIPVNLQGYRATTPRFKAIAMANSASLGNDIGYVKDVSAQLEGCDLYHPSRP